jgi:DNA replication and repair protein RecF
MYIKNLTLKNFRSWKNNSFDFTPGANVILGPNASGKTNILEALYFLSSSRSFRAEKTSQAINWDSNQSQISCQISNEENTQLGITLLQGEGQIQKSFLINKKGETRKKFLQQLQSVVFRPEDIRMITGSPSKRRQFLDLLLINVDWQYRQSLRNYNKALKQRNQLLDLIREGMANKSELFFWDQSLVKNGQLITDKRREVIYFINNFLLHHPIEYISNVSIKYLPVPISSTLLEKSYSLDLRRGSTSHGPQKDDFRFQSKEFPEKDNDLAYFASRGQQRLGVLAFKLAEIAYVKSKTNQSPILLLDDIFSELDEEHQKVILDLKTDSQIFITTTHLIEDKFWNNLIKTEISCLTKPDR